MDFTDKPPDDPKQPLKAPNIGDVDNTYRSIMSKADQQITNLVRAAGASAPRK